MKILLILTLLISACGKNSECQSNNGTVNLDNTTYTLINGVCSQTTQPDTNNSNYIDTNICGQTLITENNIVCNLTQVTSQTQGCTPVTDGFFVITNLTQDQQCWYNITNGQINSNSQPPTF